MASLRDQVTQVPDRRLNKLVGQVRDDLVVIRGTATPSDDDVRATSLVLTIEQRGILTRATVSLDTALGRVSECVRKGGRQR